VNARVSPITSRACRRGTLSSLAGPVSSSQIGPLSGSTVRWNLVTSEEKSVRAHCERPGDTGRRPWRTRCRVGGGRSGAWRTHHAGHKQRYDYPGFVSALRHMTVTSHIAETTTVRRSAIDRRTTRHAGYAISQRKRKLVEQAFGSMKAVGGMRKLRHRGGLLVGWMCTFSAAACIPSPAAPSAGGRGPNRGSSAQPPSEPLRSLPHGRAGCRRRSAANRRTSRTSRSQPDEIRSWS